MPRTDDPDALSEMLRTTLKARGDNLEHRLMTVRRKLPRKIARDADTLLSAERWSRYRPDLPPIGEAQLRKARAGIAAHVGKLDTGKDRRKPRQSWLAGLVLNLALAGVAIAAFWWLGSR